MSAMAIAAHTSCQPSMLVSGPSSSIVARRHTPLAAASASALARERGRSQRGQLVCRHAGPRAALVGALAAISRWRRRRRMRAVKRWIRPHADPDEWRQASHRRELPNPPTKIDGMGSVEELQPDDPVAFGTTPERSRKFMSEYGRPPGRPVVVRGCGAGWPALQHWRLASLGRRHGNVAFILDRHEEDDCAILVYLDDFITYCRGDGAKERNPLYIFDDCFGDEGFPAAGLLNDYKAPVVCPDLLANIEEYSRPAHRWLLVGPRRSGSFPHKDPLATAAWNAMAVGFKRWVMLPPDVAEDVIFCRHQRHPVGGPPDVFGWFDDLDVVLEQLSPEQLARSVDFTAGPGDIVWVPAGWWHAVMNLSPWTVAITENFVPIHENDGKRWLADGALEALEKSGEVFEVLEEALDGKPDAVLLEPPERVSRAG